LCLEIILYPGSGGLRGWQATMGRACQEDQYIIVSTFCHNTEAFNFDKPEC